MAGWRGIKRAARRIVHQTMEVPALLLLSNGSGPPTGFVTGEVTVRVHTKEKLLGDLKGTNFHYAEAHEEIPKIVFLIAQLTGPLERGQIVSVEAGEAYRIDTIMPADDITVTAQVTVLSAAQTSGLPVPEA